MQLLSRGHYGRIAVGTIVLAAALPLEGAITPITTTLRAEAQASVMPNLPGPADLDIDSGATGTFSVMAQDTDSDTTADGTLVSDVSITGSANVSDDGTSGTASFDAVWIATNTKPITAPNQGGTFAMVMRFTYSFLTDEPVTLLVEVDTTLGGTGETTIGFPAMNVNHAITFDNSDFVDISMNAVTQAQYDVPAGVFQFQIDHAPNLGRIPWPNVAMTFASRISFTIIPEPMSALLLATGALVLRPRRIALP